MYTLPGYLFTDAFITEGLYTCISCFVQAQIEEIVLGCLIRVGPLCDSILTCDADGVNTYLLTVDLVEGEEIGAVVDHRRPAARGGADHLTGRCKPAEAKYDGEGDESEEKECCSDGLVGIVVVECAASCRDDTEENEKYELQVHLYKDITMLLYRWMLMGVRTALRRRKAMKHRP